MATSQVLLSETSRESRNGAINTCRRGHALTPDNIQRIGKAGVRCKICRQRIAREHARRKTGFYARHPEQAA